MSNVVVSRGESDICTRYRPRRMSEVVGTDAVVQALTRAIDMGEGRPKAYMFYGDSGCGKTTAARIMAMGLNCEEGDTPEPCLECSNCKMAVDGGAMHITELNLAQLNKKEDADGIIQEMDCRPWTGRNNCYIFDEAQMLTTAAQNLMLKKLEEPPPNTYIFICTTHPKKIIKTLQNRCEQHHFKNPSSAAVAILLKEVFKQENWEMSDEDKKRFFKIVQGRSYREILKAIDQVMRGGLDSLDLPDDADPQFIEICRAVSKKDFKAVSELWRAMKKNGKPDCEGLRLCLLGYFSSTLLKSRNGSAAKVMGRFLEPMFDHDAEPRMVYNLYMACGER